MWRAKPARWCPHRVRTAQRRRWPLAASVLLLVACLPLPVRATCELDSLAGKLPDVCSRMDADCLPAYLPEDIRRIVHGVVLEWVGLTVNDGRARWSAVDFDRHQSLVVERYAGAHLAEAATQATAAGESVHASGQGAARRIDRVRRHKLSTARFHSLSCKAAQLVAGESALAGQGSDAASRLLLLLPRQAGAATVQGSFSGAAQDLEGQLAERRTP